MLLILSAHGVGTLHYITYVHIIVYERGYNIFVLSVLVHRSEAEARKHAGRVPFGLAKVRLVAAEAQSVVQPGRADQENRYAPNV